MPSKKYFVLLYSSFFVYSLSGILSKIASQQDFLSLPYLFCFAGIIIILSVYALLWQLILKKVPLSIAMANKPFVLILSLLWAVLLFNESISLKTFTGIVFILCGIGIIGRVYRAQ